VFPCDTGIFKSKIINSVGVLGVSVFILELFNLFTVNCLRGFGGLEEACWPLVPKFAVSNPDVAVGLFRAKNMLSTPSFGGEVKPSATCRRFLGM